MGTAGFKYKDASGTGAPGGAQKALLKSGAAGKSKVLVKGKGTALPDTLVPALPLPVKAQLVNDESSVCYEAVYNAPQVLKNDAKQFKAKQESRHLLRTPRPGIARCRGVVVSDRHRRRFASTSDTNAFLLVANAAPTERRRDAAPYGRSG
jgi:hypothetical protein